MAEIICPRCGTPNRDTARFCADCGATLIPAAQPTSDPANSRPGGRGAAPGMPAPDSVLEGRYRIEAELGRGGFGAVFKALDQRLNKPVAIKENLDTSPEAQRQFSREATILANLSHPNLPRVIDHFTLPGLGQYLVMDFVDGEDLNSMINREGCLPPVQALTWIMQVAEALEYLHTQQPPVLHRDVKPANIRLTSRGKAMLVDFGLVKFTDPSVKTTMGARAITPGYAPPEQYGAGNTDARTDIYALGATLYRAITGREPAESVQRMSGQTNLPVSQIKPEIPASVGRAIEQAMALEPAKRYQSAADFHASLQACMLELKVRSGGLQTPAWAPGQDSRPRPGAGQSSGPVVAQPVSQPRSGQSPDYVSGPASGGPVAPYVVAPAHDGPASKPSKPASRPRPSSKPISRPLQPQAKMALGAGAGLIVLLVIVAAVLGGYGLYLYGQSSTVGGTATVQAQATQMAQLSGTKTAQAVLLNPGSAQTVAPAIASGPGKMAIEGVYGAGTLDYERIVLENKGGSPIDLTGWKLENSPASYYVFSKLSLGPGQKITLYTGSGKNTETSLYRNLPGASFKSGDKITLYDSQGKVQAVYTIK